MTLNENDIKNVKSLIANSKNIAIITHFNPDADAVGSSIGLYLYLKAKRKNVNIIMPNPFPSFLDFFATDIPMILGYKETKKANDLLLKSDIIFCLDFNMIHRVGNANKDALLNSPATKILIDHHQLPEKHFNILFSNPNASSTTEVLAHFIKALSGKRAITFEMAQAIYIGICTDTGSFSYNCNNAETYALVSDLIAKGVKADMVHQEVYNTFSENRLRLLGYSIAEKLKVFPKYQAAYICLTKEELRQYHFQPGDTEGLVNYCLNLKGINFGCLITERDRIIRLSFRSKVNTFDVNQFARKYWDGGGHIMASGGTYQGKLEDVIIALEKQIKTLKDEI
ncbi:MAG: bifunctional oligoribonuclease/PAP phosphatase NrnA [Bacteroidales bacterium]|jgi:phosphoesterase RecJ-like protein|nr:bifunctional oligoribonuclease/PAP phosphatase NrnA [Bacteroidales bacterium]